MPAITRLYATLNRRTRRGLRTAINCSGLGTEEIRALRADPEGNLKQ